MKENQGFCPDGAQQKIRSNGSSTCNGALDSVFNKQLYYSDD